MLITLNKSNFVIKKSSYWLSWRQNKIILPFIRFSFLEEGAESYVDVVKNREAQTRAR